MWRATRVLREVTKTSTGIVGIPVNPNARSDLLVSCREVLNQCAAHLPAGDAFRARTEQVFNHRLKVAQENDDEDKIEELLNCGQLEELIIQGEEQVGRAE
ncbi:unnamed protein product [Chrysoparadoxa australica]